MPAPLSLLSIHAHPDDESSKGAGTVAKYHAEGVRTTLVCCTGGEEGDILNPAMDTDEVKADIGKIRRAELDRAAEIIGYDEVVMLGYRDSGMPDSEANKNPEAFANADLDEAVGRIVAVIRRTRPQVILSYGDEREWYPHPDHLRVHEVTQPAVERAADPEWYPEAGEPWQVSKIYHSIWSRARMVAMHEKFLELGLKSPFDDSRWTDRPGQDHLITTQIPIDDHAHVRLDALLAHATQIDPNSPFWFGLPREVAVTIHPFDDYVRDLSLVDTPLPEHDLFSGLREHAASSR
jgi:mycothiol S-conjugate amidase